MKKKRRRWLRVSLLVLLPLFALAGLVAWRLPVGRTMNVVSIKTLPAYQDPALLQRAWSLPVARAYREAQPISQPNVSACGPTTVADLMRSLGTAGATVATALDGTGRCRLGVCWGGLTLDEVADLAAQKTGRRATVLRDLPLAEFREHLRRANDPERRYLINFDRGPLFGRTGGHHSPIAGYLAADDLVLVLDVNAGYGPWLVPAARLYEAVDTVDSSSGRKRGLVLLQ